MGVLMNGVKAIIFDLGKVVIELHYERAANLFSEISGSEKLADFLISSDTLREFEVGKISENTFRMRICDELGIVLSDNEFDAKWNSMLGEISKKRIEKLLELKKHFKTLILSNTNSIHVRSFNALLRKTNGYEGVHELVQKAYYSHEVGMRKPNTNIYEFVLKAQGLQPKEVLFIDDREDNVEAAQELGIKVFLNNHVDDWLEVVD